MQFLTDEEAEKMRAMFAPDERDWSTLEERRQELQVPATGRQIKLIFGKLALSIKWPDEDRISDQRQFLSTMAYTVLEEEFSKPVLMGTIKQLLMTEDEMPSTAHVLEVAREVRTQLEAEMESAQEARNKSTQTKKTPRPLSSKYQIRDTPQEIEAAANMLALSKGWPLPDVVRMFEALKKEKFPQTILDRAVRRLLSGYGDMPSIFFILGVAREYRDRLEADAKMEAGSPHSPA
jgi:hypothetical protein